MSAFEPYPQRGPQQNQQYPFPGQPYQGPGQPYPTAPEAYPTAPPAYYQEPQFRTVNKIVYVLLAFFLGGFGVHRFLRGQVGIGICMILFNWLTIGIWALVEFIIGCVKLSKYPGDDFIFTQSGDWIY
ncbi:TM2 domain-containing protein [Actinotignum timonense]|uniref:TM2 domain-containing protein n=1 Tax=Actinotignum TaxID=1653174 RepID=UPI00254F9CB5|nr:NINE protein [Actinotignum timonense]MDK6906638.1 NINE protein [Actinotignum timonense]MDY5138333.1 NINE protein [Actinotignum timonense]